MKLHTLRMTAIAIACSMSAAMVLGGATAASATTQNEFYVATTGSDSTGNGSAASPWATIQKARDHIEANGLNDAMTGDINVYVGAGDYYVSDTIAFDDEDSGSNGHSINYRNLDAVGSARFIGGERVTGWTQYSGNIYKADVGPGWEFETLFENGTRAWEARYPNRDPGASTTSQAGYLNSSGVTGSRTVLQYKAGDLDPSSWDVSDAEIFIWSGDAWDWFTDTVPIAGIDTATRQITLAQPTRYAINQSSYHNDGSRYFVQGVLDLLDQPGEFYLDESAGELYYSARDGAIEDQQIIAPKVKRILSLTGSSDTDRVHHVSFDGLTFEGSDFTDWYRHAHIAAGDSGEGHLYPEYDRQMTMPDHRTGMVYLENTDHISILNCHLKNSGYSAIYMLFHNQDNLVAGNLIEHIGHSGIILEGRYPGEGDVLKNNVLTNNLIHDVGELVGHAAGVYIMNASGNEVSYSEIYNSPRYAVAIDAYVRIPIEDVYTRNNTVKYLKVHHTTQDSGDTGSLYEFGTSPVSGAPHNVNSWDQITIDESKAHRSVTDYAPNGVFMDGDSYGQSFSNIKVTNSQGAKYRTLSGEDTFTNVNWTGTFNESLMDYANIGIKSDFPYPVAPTALSASAATSQIDLSWQGARNAASYDVLRSGTSGGPYTTVVCSGVTTTTCADTAVASGTTYFYVVVARTSAGLISAPSSEAAELFGDFTSDGFENGIGIWDSPKGVASTSTTQAHSGSRSYVVDEDVDVVTRSFTANQSKVATVWFYDDASNLNRLAFTKVDDSSWDNGALWRGVGVATATSASKYSMRVNGTITPTTVNRSTGWHEFRFDYSSGTKVDISIDGILVGSPTGVTTFTHISLGDWWADGNTDAAYFDDVTVSDAATVPPFSGDDFEGGLAAWATAKGTASVTSAQAHSPSSSFAVDQDADVITHSFDVIQNGLVKVWFYDDGGTNRLVMAKVDDGGWGSSTVWRSIGVATPTSASKYVIRLGASTTATTVSRSTGWHEFAFDFRSGTRVDMSIDGTLVASPTGVTGYNHISLGDWWSDGRTAVAYFDDVTIQ
jgi:hypothetical protein